MSLPAGHQPRHEDQLGRHGRDTRRRQVPADQAFHTAYLRALKQLEDNAIDRQAKSGKDKAEPPMLAEERTRAVDRVQKELDALKSNAKPDKAQPAKDHQTRTGG